ncbi:SET and MYND domain-containing protein 4-like [Aphidius gifuensis]|uniref:SET and MYND domain-containing protein 4-like n=1 Tax=Aphidius gifuensis TaxID=684658 RepID=UPI001CDCE338|nr:SET and MYND domain-containing protein 4-like [Aphidius gifuensis]XP_044004244.1 SET and MYND domain-containing protein 4-like [Aphidius gifuensis]
MEEGSCACCYGADDCESHGSYDLEGINKKFLKKKTFEDRFEVVWKFMAETGPMGHCNNIKVDKTVGDSTHWRTIGNIEYTTAINKNYLSKSIEAYTKSIAFAPVGSSELSLGYGNRSAVLFKVRLYEDCLVDIERALTSGYPDNLKTKLFVRQALCFKALQPDFDIESSSSIANAMKWLPKLQKKNPNYNVKEQYSKMINDLGKPCDTNTIKFTPIIENNNPIIAGASDAIELKNTKKNKQHLVATRDIKPGEFIYINKPFEVIACEDERYNTCWHCCRQTWTGVPCNECPNVIFCSPECRDIAWKEYHDFECPILSLSLKVEMDVEDDWRFQLTIQILSKAIKAAGGITELKKKIDDVESSADKSMVFKDGIFDVNTIDNFHRLKYFQPTSERCSFGRVIRITSIVSMFGLDTTIFGKKMSLFAVSCHEHSVILGGLIFRYLMIVDRNVVFYTKQAPNDVKLTHAVIIPILQMFVKNCDPHVNWYNCDPNATVLVERPIKKGEKILFSPVGRYQDLSFFERQRKYFSFAEEPCKCNICVQKLPIAEHLPSYKTLKLSKQVENELKRIVKKSSGYLKLVSEGDTEKLLNIKDTLVEMTDKFYQHVTVPCDEASLFPLMLGMLYHQLGIPRRIIQ